MVSLPNRIRLKEMDERKTSETSETSETRDDSTSLLFSIIYILSVQNTGE